MTIKPGEAWGVDGTVPSSAVLCTDDRALAKVTGEVMLTGGDVWECLGRPPVKRKGEPCVKVPVDRLRCAVRTSSGLQVVNAMSHLRIGRWVGCSRFVVATNPGFLGGRNICPRAHPNDGLFDMLFVDESMPLRERLIARSRARQGNHLPHPCIRVDRAADHDIVNLGREILSIDGRRVGDWISVSITIESDAVAVLI